MILPQIIIDGLAKLLADMRRLVATIPPPQIPPPEKPPIIPAPKQNDLLTLFALAIRNFEGWGVPGSRINGIYYPNGTRSYKCNNPGNVKYYSGGYASMYGKVGKDKDGFAEC